MADPYEHFTAQQIATASQCPLAAVQDTWPRLVEQLTHAGINERLVQVGLIGTIAIESASTFRPVREAFFLGEPEPAETHRKTLRYYPFYGRGLIQNTWEAGYRALGPKIAALWQTDQNQPDFDLVANPDNLLDPDFSAAAAAIFFRDTKTLQGYGIVDACRASDWEWVRRLVLGGPDPAGVARITRIAADLAAGTPIPSTPRNFDPNTPTELQRQDWTCSIRSTMWMLKSLGIAVTPEEAQDAMSPQYVTPDQGLLNATGAGIVAVLRDHWGIGANNDADATFDDVAAVAGRQPVAIGLRNWGGPNKGHWSAVRNVGADRLMLANPAGTGPIYGQQTLTRAEFDARGPASMVTIPLGTAPAPTAPPVIVPPVPEPDKAAIAQGLRYLLAKHDAYDQAMRADFDRLIKLAEALP